jgi:peptidyl-dipeptidase A
MSKSQLCLRSAAAGILLGACALAAPALMFAADDALTMRAQKFVDAHVLKLQPLEKAAALAWWDANTSGKDEDFRRKEETQNRIDAALADPAAFAQVKAIQAAGGIPDPVLKREIDVLYLAYLEKQVDPALLKKIVEKSNGIEKAFNVFRAKVEGKELSENDVRKVLKESRNSDARRKAWEAGKAVGSVVERDLIELVKLRNQAAAALGFKSFQAMQFFLNEQDESGVLNLFEDLDKLTREPFRAAKAEIDERLAKNCGVNVSDLRPWHYHDPFFQECPAVFGVNLDSLYASADILKLCRDFYAGIGLPIDDVIGRSDLYEKPGKSPHAFCTDIDRAGDVRVLGNIVPNEQWMETMLHELGHSVYSSKNIPASVPYVLRAESHILTTEGVAMMFGRLAKNGPWQAGMGVAPREPAERLRIGEAGAKLLRDQLLIFSRWCQVMLHFEKGLYENPDQNLNQLWWDLVEQYQMVRRPEGRNAPDFASKIHIVSAPVYYHNYMMGELFASQVHHAICRDVFHGAPPAAVGYVGNRAVGDFLRERVFGPGRTLDWRELTRHATGEDLNPKAFASDFKAN